MGGSRRLWRMRASDLLWSSLVLASGLAAQQTDYPEDIRALLADHCFDCHAGPEVEGNLDLARLPATAEADFLARLLRVRDKVRTAAMPPPADAHLEDEDRARLVAWIEGTAVERAAALPLPSPTISIRRLSRGQLAGVLRDVFGVVSESVRELPADDLGYGFDTVADAMSFSSLHLEKYLAVAADVATQVIDIEDPASPRVQRTEVETVAEGVDGVSVDGEFANFYTNAEVGWAVTLPRAGRYEVRVRLYGDQAGDAAPRLELTVDGGIVGAFDVPEERAAAATKTAGLDLEGGSRRVAVRFVNDFYAPDAADRRRRDRNLRVDWVEVAGPLEARPVPAGSTWWWQHDRPGAADAARARAVLAPLLERAWRAPVDPTALDELVAVVQDAVARGEKYTVGLRAAIVALLSAPSFLFRIDGADGDGADGGAASGDDHGIRAQYQLAARLSFFLWSSVPDDALLARARAGELGDPGVCDAEVARMLRDARASVLATEFAAQWLELRTLRDVAPDPGRFGAIPPALLADMQRETELLFEAVFREGRDVRELLTADFTFLNRRLASHYGHAGIDSEDLRRVPVPDPRRAGVLGHASVLTLTSNPTRTSVVKRGKWVLESLLGDPPPPPPPGTASLEGAVIDSAADLRAQMARHRADEACAACHTRMDALGFAFEGLDAVGRFRVTEPPIDDRGELAGGRIVQGLAGLRSLLAADPAFPRALATKLFVYAIGRPPGAADAVRIEAMVQACERRGSVTVADLVLGIVRQPAFRQGVVIR